MNSLHDDLVSLCHLAIECNDQAYSENKDPDDAEDRLADLLETIIEEQSWMIAADLKKYLGAN
jgi:hypothetical protein